MKKFISAVAQLCGPLTGLALVVGGIIMCNTEKFVWSAIMIAFALLISIVGFFVEVKAKNSAREIEMYKRDIKEAEAREAIFHKTIEDQRKENYSLSETIGALQAQLASTLAYNTTLKAKLSRKPRPKTNQPL